MIRSARASINLAALQHNFQRVKQLAPESRVMAVIKADAYGHGMIQSARALSEQASYADAFAVAHLTEALSLRAAQIQQPILVLQGFQNKAELEQMSLHSIWPVVHQHWQVECLQQFSGRGIDVWMKVNTGMGRLGFSLNEAKAAWVKLDACNAVRSLTLMSHLANADVLEHALNDQQIHAFQQLANELDAETSLCNSAGLIQFPLAQGSWVRPGIMLYGASPVQGRTAAALNLQPVMTLDSHLIAINALQAGDSIGYGSEYQCPQDMRIGIVAIGYGDGYPRHVHKASVYINGQHLAIIGRVSMDMLCVDLRLIEHVKPGDKVELWGKNISVDQIAESAETIAYELLCNLSKCR